MAIVHLEPAMVPQHMRGSYTGKQFKAQIGEIMTIPATAGLWEGGSRETFRFIRISDGAQVDAVRHQMAPWDGARRDIPVTLRPGFAVVMHSFFSGKDSGLTFYIHPQDAAPMLPAPVEVTALQQIILDYTNSRKASYGGKDRYDMARDDWSFRRDAGPFPYSRALWEEGKAELAAQGYLNKAGAITTKGRNLAGSV